MKTRTAAAVTAHRPSPRARRLPEGFLAEPRHRSTARETGISPGLHHTPEEARGGPEACPRSHRPGGEKLGLSTLTLGDMAPPHCPSSHRLLCQKPLTHERSRLSLEVSRHKCPPEMSPLSPISLAAGFCLIHTVPCWGDPFCAQLCSWPGLGSFRN